jgi:hypothetical protein
MANKTFVWIGGLTGSGANRFSWHEPGNWAIEQKENGVYYYYGNDTGTVPGPLDTVKIGVPGYDASDTSGTYKWKVHAPLLWGGFLGGISGGHWGGLSYGFTAGPYQQSITKQGLTGTTFNSSLARFEVNGKFGGWGPDSFYNTYFYFNYPYPVIGGGLTGDNIELLKGVSVAGMTFANWDYLAENCTDAQSSLRIKTNKVVLSGEQNDTVSKYNQQTVWNNYSLDGNWASRYQNRKNTKRRVYLTLVDNLGTTGGVATKNNINTSVVVDGTGIEAYLKDSKIISLNTDFYLEEAKENAYPGFNPQRTNIIYPVNIVLDNCAVMSITSNEYPFLLTTYPNCVIGTITAKFVKNIFKSSAIQAVGITWDETKPLHNLTGQFSTKAATAVLYPGTTLGYEDTNFNYSFNNTQLKQLFYDITTYSGGLAVPQEGKTLASCIVQLGDKDLSPQIGNYPLGGTFAAYGGVFAGVPDYAINNPSDNMKNLTKVVFGNTGKIETLDLKGTVSYGDRSLDTNDVISIMTCKVGFYSAFNFNKSLAFKNWRFGFINGITYAGGLIFDDSTINVVHGQEGLRFLNYGVYGKTINTRSNTIYDTIATAAPPIREEA